MLRELDVTTQAVLNAISKKSVEDESILRKQLEEKTAEVKGMEKKANKFFNLNIFLAITLLISTLASVVMQFRQASIQDDQAAFQVGLHLVDNWDRAFDIDNRFRFDLFMNSIVKWKDPEAAKTSLARLVNSVSANNIQKWRADDNLMEILRGMNENKKDLSDAEILNSAKAMRNTIIHSLNTLESIVVIRQQTNSPQIRHTIDMQFRGIIKIWVSKTMPFIEVYRKTPPYDSENPPAWQPLTADPAESWWSRFLKKLGTHKTIQGFV